MKRTLVLILAVANFRAYADPTANYETRNEVREFAAAMANRHGFDEATLLVQFHHARFLPAVIKAILPPADPGIRSWKTYRARFVESKRIKAGVKFIDAHRATLLRAEKQYGVPAEIIAAIIGVETIYGSHTGSFETFSTLTTLAFDYPPRAELFRRELEALLLLARDEGRAPESYRGSYAGALGLPQFLPSSVRTYAEDFNGDGRVDLTDATDAIGSVARFLAEHGWQRGAPIAAVARLGTATAKDLLAEGIEPRRSVKELREMGIDIGSAPDQPAALIDLVTPGAATEYRLGYRNFYVLTRYNRSSFYASAVTDLAMALRGAL
ncbi:MAG: lytic murein transglycosylase B [Rhodocyclaceae bacterium]|nr:lytic murein transglycosylase B [Rhodocyclaceae bacterium]